MVRSPQAICYRALKLINALGQAQTPDAEDINDCYESMQEMIDGWAVDRLSVIVVERAVFPLTTGVQTYTIGENGDFDRNRPVWLPNASIINNANTNQPLELPISVLSYDEWQRVPIKNMQSGLPTALYYDHAYSTAGLGNIQVFPVPNVTNLQLVLYCPTPITQLGDKTTPYDWAPAYLRAVTWNLAVEVAPLFSIVPTSTVTEKAREFLADVRRANIQPYVVMVDRALISKGDLFNYYTGEPY